ncbi:MAG: hypothetical protein LBJ73_03745 [Rickettsiales bacterium]|jgi:hypothetical protein|nr:hypothetical protein [Rickettsiales bacterium]
MKKLLVVFFGIFIFTTAIAADVALQKNVQEKKAVEQSMANRVLGAASVGAVGIGGSKLAQGLSETKSDQDAETDARAYLATFRCDYGGPSFKGGEMGISLPGQEGLTPLRAEYRELAANLKQTKAALGMASGIESAEILDSADSGLYDDVGTGITGGVYASVSRALQNPAGEDAAAWEQQKSDAQQNLKTGTALAVGGAAVALVGNVVVNKIGLDKVLGASGVGLTPGSIGDVGNVAGSSAGGTAGTAAITGYDGAAENARAAEKTAYDRLGEFGARIGVTLNKDMDAAAVGTALKGTDDYKDFADKISVPLVRLRTGSDGLTNAVKNVETKTKSLDTTSDKLKETQNTLKEKQDALKEKQDALGRAEAAHNKAVQAAIEAEEDEPGTDTVDDAKTAVSTAKTAEGTAQKNVTDSEKALDKARADLDQAKNDVVKVSREMQSAAVELSGEIDKGMAFIKQTEEKNAEVEKDKLMRAVQTLESAIEELKKQIGDKYEYSGAANGYADEVKKARDAEAVMYEKLAGFGASVGVALNNTMEAAEIIGALKDDYKDFANKISGPLSRLKTNSAELASADATAKISAADKAANKLKETQNAKSGVADDARKSADNARQIAADVKSTQSSFKAAQEDISAAQTAATAAKNALTTDRAALDKARGDADAAQKEVISTAQNIYADAQVLSLEIDNEMAAAAEQDNDEIEEEDESDED